MELLYSHLVVLLQTLLLLLTLKPIALRIGLVDRPEGHKLHSGDIPLVGGIAMFGGFLLASLMLSVPFAQWQSFVLASAMLVITGVWDDLYTLSPWSRFGAQIAAALVMALKGGVVVESLGDLLGKGPIILETWTVPFTVFATVGVINAINMIDGLDGLAGSLMLCLLLSLAGLAVLAGLSDESKILWVLAVVVGAFLILNLRLPGRRHARIFMGDAGSMFLGLTAAWFLISLSQAPQTVMTPVTALWLLAMPLLDTVSVMLRRLLQGRSPFAPARDHFHHLLLRLGCSVSRTVAVMVSLAMLLSGVGLAGLYLQLSERGLFYGFLSLFLVYFLTTWVAWKVLSPTGRERTGLGGSGEEIG